MTPAVPASPRLALTGLTSVLLGVPLTVLESPMGPYDDPKAWAIAILMALTGLAWMAQAGRRSRAGAPAPDPTGRIVTALVLAGTGWSLVATLSSVAPAQSVFGTFGRGVGFLTIGFTALAFFVTRSECRTPAAIRRVVDLALLGSVPVCLLAVGQAVGWDPLPRSWDPAVRTLTIRSTFGTHVFLGSYLVVLVPLTLGRLAWALSERSQAGRWPVPTAAQWRRCVLATIWVIGAVALLGAGARWPVAWCGVLPWAVLGAVALRPDVAGARSGDSALTISLLGVLLAGQVTVVLLSQGRGAFIGLVFGLGVTGFALLVRRRAWKTLGTTAALAAALGVFLVLLNVSGSPLARLGKARVLGRLGAMTDVQPGSPGWVRLQLWSGISDGWRRQLRGESVIPGVAPAVRSLIGYGPETQLVVLEPLSASFARKLSASGEGWYARYVFDRAHNALLDRLITEGLIGIGLWTVLIASLILLGVSRLRSSTGPAETAVRVGALGAILGHLADAQVGMTTPMPLLVFWVAAGLLTLPSWRLVRLDEAPVPERRPRRLWWRVAWVATALVALSIGIETTRWLFASMAYASGVRQGIAGHLPEAYGDFLRSTALAPWLPLPAESAAYTALRLATAESVASRRVTMLLEADALLRQARTYAIGGPGWWALRGQIALAAARTGQPALLATSREAFDMALQLRPEDPRLLAQLAWVSLESGDLLHARRTAERALAREPGEWMAWAVLGKVLRSQGDGPGAQQAANHARDLAPAEARPLLEALQR